MAEPDEFLTPDEYEPRTPQDDLDWKDEDTDLVITEENEDITEVLHVDPERRREIMEENEDPDSEQSEDYRENVEDQI